MVIDAILESIILIPYLDRGLQKFELKGIKFSSEQNFLKFNYYCMIKR